MYTYEYAVYTNIVEWGGDNFKSLRNVFLNSFQRATIINNDDENSIKTRDNESGRAAAATTTSTGERV